MDDPLQRLKLQIEALLFAAEHAVDVTEIRSHLGEVSLAEVRLALRDLSKDYETRAFNLFEFGGKYQLRTREEYADLVSKQFVSKPRSLSKSALETLAIVAYQQPVTRAQVSAVRGVDSSAIVQSLKDRDLIYVSGTRKEVGTPLEYRTTTKFLEVFGLSKLEDLPNLRSLQMSAEDTRQVAKALAAANGEEEATPTSDELSFIDAEVIENAVSTEEIAAVSAAALPAEEAAVSTATSLPEPSTAEPETLVETKAGTETDSIIETVPEIAPEEAEKLEASTEVEEIESAVMEEEIEELEAEDKEEADPSPQEEEEEEEEEAELLRAGASLAAGDEDDFDDNDDEFEDDEDDDDDDEDDDDFVEVDLDEDEDEDETTLAAPKKDSEPTPES